MINRTIQPTIALPLGIISHISPTFLAAIAGYTHPQQRAESICVFRLWRDLGYAIGALLTGIIADTFGIDISILVIGGFTVLSAFIILVRMGEEN